MAERVIHWKDSHGNLHDTEAAAEEANRQYEVGDRRRAVRKHLWNLLDETVPPASRKDYAPFLMTTDAVDWLIANWPAIKAIGFAYRLDDLAPPAKE